jgi:glycine reductase
MLRVVHYVNQFFGGIGGEEQAGVVPRAVDGPLGPGQVLQRYLGNDATVAGTLICGDNYFAEQQEAASRALLGMLADARADLLVAGPAFAAGRYGLACAHLCAEAQQAFDLPAVTGLSPDNPAVEAYRRTVTIVPTGPSAASMSQAMERLAALGLKLARREPLGQPDEEGYLAHGFRRNTLVAANGAQRALAMLHAKLAGEPYATEIALPTFEPVPAAPPLADLATATLALITSGGLVPRGNPDRLKSHVADAYGRYSIADRDALSAEAYEAVHGGYHTVYVNDDPHRLVPLDALRALVGEGALGGLHPMLYTLAGTGTYPQFAERMGHEVAAELRAAGVDAALITST